MTQGASLPALGSDNNQKSSVLQAFRIPPTIWMWSVGCYGKLILWQVCRSSLLDRGTLVVREDDTFPASWITPFKDSIWDLDLKIFWCISKRFSCLLNYVLRHSHESNHLNHFVLNFSPSYFSVRLFKAKKNRNFDSTLVCFFFSFAFSGASPHTIPFSPQNTWLIHSI